eukprot:8984269-Prorocentrum_lima.AAC.1
MTSSLVGSEMCIRDRICPMRELECRKKWGHLTEAERVETPNYHTYAQAVSYTHLTLPTICSV